MKEYNYLISGMDYMLNEKSHHQSHRDQQPEAVRNTRENQKSVTPVRAALIALINLVTGYPWL